ncbi:MAG: carboxypeptidase regulatory-like domain-containing protein [Acidobacteriota bacterium]
MARHTPLKLIALVTFTFLLLGPLVVAAQSPTGSVTGQVFDTQGRPVAGVTVTATSTSLQGEQKATTSANGDYIFKLLPPGNYTLSFEKAGFAAASNSRAVAAGEPVTIDVTLQTAAVKESVTVVGETRQFLNTIEGAANFKQTTLNLLPTSRTMLSAVNLSPSVHATGPGGNYSFSGAMSFENSFMVNGVQIQDNLRGDPFNLFIEDAIQETTVTTSNVSAEYGRFSGGIVNTLTKSGGNTLSGSFRESFSNDNWRTVSPFGEPKVNKTVPTSEFTLGGPILKDRLWFFGAGRLADTQLARQTGYSKVPYTFEDNEKRFEGKLTHSPAIGQRIELSYIGIREAQKNSAYPNSAGVMDLASLTNPSYPQNLLGLHYTGSFGGKFFLEGQYSARRFTFKNAGGSQTDLINGTPLLDQQTGAYWWAPNFCAVCPEERRDNDDLVVKGSYFVSSKSGSHDIVFGYDGFNDKTFADNHQSGSDYHVWATSSFVGDNGVVYPIIDPDGSTYIIHWPVQQNSKGTNFRTHSFFVNDSWAFDRHLSFSLGLRYDKSAGRDASDALVANDSVIGPHFAMAYDPKGDGRTSFRVGFNRYVSAINNAVAGSTSAAGNPSIIAFAYEGAPINEGGPLVSSADALRQVFDWFALAQNDPNYGPFFVNIPGVSSKIDGSLKSPHTDEASVGVSQQLGSRASVRVDFVNRTYGDFYAGRIDTTTGTVFDTFGQPYDLKLLQNTDALTRTYRGLSFIGNYRASGGVNVGGSYTLSELRGNVNGENVNTGPLDSDILSYPEYSKESWGYPTGDLAADQRHRARLWATYALPWHRLGTMTVSAVQSIDSGTPYGAVGAVDSTRFVTDVGYVTPPIPVSYFFTARDAFRTDAMKRTDLAFSYSRRVGPGSGPELFAQFQLLNVFNQFQVFNGDYINTTVVTRWDSATYARFNPFTTTPVEGVNWAKGDKFGQAISKSAYTVPRTFRFSVGVRF